MDIGTGVALIVVMIATTQNTEDAMTDTYTLRVNGETIGTYDSAEDALLAYVTDCDGGTARIYRPNGLVDRVMTAIDDDWNYCAWTERSYRATRYVARVTEDGKVVK